MKSYQKEAGIFTPEELKDLQDQLNQGNLPEETTVDRESRAAEILQRKRPDGPPT